MSARLVDKDLALRLEAVRRDHGETVRVDQIAEVVRALLANLSGDINAADLRLYHELESLATYIHNAKAELASLRPHDLQDQYIAKATDELDAIVDATETATNSILDAAEKIESLSGDMSPEVAERLGNITTQIYEACNFQDITGQRITKVVRTLKEIEIRVESLVAAFGPMIRAEEEQAEEEQAGNRDKQEEKQPLTDQDLLNGPQLPQVASKQDEIDALLASFD